MNFFSSIKLIKKSMKPTSMFWFQIRHFQVFAQTSQLIFLIPILLLTACDWTIVSSCYMNHQSSMEKKAWKDFFLSLGLQMFISPQKVSLELHKTDLVNWIFFLRYNFLIDWSFFNSHKYASQKYNDVLATRPCCICYWRDNLLAQSNNSNHLVFELMIEFKKSLPLSLACPRWMDM